MHTRRGGLRTRTPKEFAERHGKPDEILLRAVSGMLPKNKLRPVRLRRLTLFPGSHYDLAQKYPHLATNAKAAAALEGVPFQPVAAAAPVAEVTKPVPARLAKLARDFNASIDVAAVKGVNR